MEKENQKVKKKLIRIFFAFDIDEDLRQAISQILNHLRTQPRGNEVKWIPSENLHVTLRFLGETEPDIIESVIKEVGKEIKDSKTFSLRVGRVMHFPPNSNHPKAIVVSFPLSQELADLVQTIERGVSKCGFEPENRAFLPHLTLARLRAKQELDLSDIPIKIPQTLHIKEVILYRSDPGPKGSVYTAMTRFKLA
jgi:2'-5' RNA ligase